MEVTVYSKENPGKIDDFDRLLIAGKSYLLHPFVIPILGIKQGLKRPKNNKKRSGMLYTLTIP